MTILEKSNFNNFKGILVKWKKTCTEFSSNNPYTKNSSENED